ncbi:protein JINGUBANG [Salvia miltiorrhiza]|uniref:protein JINGUBANG n=1 Tax=Salvia miltiorrhiza TaxID=226208 RepID=UPI0025ABF392|nr:protein JINGUBANG [Salvia miltiorrhiza]
MIRFTHCSSPSHSDQVEDSDPSSNSSSLSSQPSLPSVPSLTDLPPSTATHHHCLATLKGHSSSIFSLSLAGKHLYSGVSDGQIRVWDRNPSSYTDNGAVSESRSAVKSIVVSGDKLFTAHSDNKIRVWKIDNYSGDGRRCTAVAVLPTVSDRCMSLFSAKNYVKVRRHKRCTWVHHVDAVAALAATSDGALLYSVSWDRSFKIWRSSDFRCVESVQNAHDDAINAVVLSADGHVYTGSADRRIKVWRINGGDQKHSLVSTLEKHKSAVNALALSGDGSVLYSGACDRSIIVWERDGGAAHMAVAGALRGHTKAILCLAVVGEVLCSGSADRTVRVWRRGIGNSYSCLAVLEGHRNPVKSLTAGFDTNHAGDSDNSYLVYSGSLDFEIKVWKIRVPLIT